MKRDWEEGYYRVDTITTSLRITQLLAPNRMKRNSRSWTIGEIRKSTSLNLGKKVIWSPCFQQLLL